MGLGSCRGLCQGRRRRRGAILCIRFWGACSRVRQREAFCLMWCRAGALLLWRLQAVYILETCNMRWTNLLTLSSLYANTDLYFGFRIPRPSRSTSSCTRKDSVNGFFFFMAFIAAKRKRKESPVWLSFGLLLRYWTNTLAATYKQKDINGFI